MVDWQATASPENLRLRARLLAEMRQFFAERDVLEVETPLLCHATVTDLHLRSFSVPTQGDEFYLQTSPEYAMKRLLACGSGSIFQICKAFRQEEQSKQHNAEFTMLEWYRVGYSLHDLMNEVEDLVRRLLNCEPIPRFSYRELFQQHLEFDPHRISFAELQKFVGSRLSLTGEQLDASDYLQLLMTHIIEPRLPAQCFVHDYPAAQAALAKREKDESGTTLARRFELYGGGMELANGYLELADPQEQSRRFQQDLSRRTALDLPPAPVDDRLLAALQHGLPECAGVALGVDRLLMILAGAASIDEVISFPWTRA